MSQSIQITVHRGSPPSNSYVWSPFVTKLEARLRFDDVSYHLGSGTPRTAPKGKIPYVEVNSESFGDSTLIIRNLVSNGVVRDLNASLGGATAAHDLGIRAMMEDRVYFYGTREKWMDNYDVMRTNMLASVPWPMQRVVGWMVYNKVEATLQGQGTGRLTEEEVRTFKEEVWENVNALVTEAKTAAKDEEPFWVLGGDEPTEADSSLFGFVVGGLVCDA